MIGLTVASFFCVMLFAHGAQAEKVLCYVCSWHSPTIYEKSTNITDHCSHYKFDALYSGTVECDGGCEAVSIRKTKNGEIVNFYKNCKSSSSLRDDCSSEDSVNHVTTCVCSSDLCNAAVMMTGKLSFGWVNAFSFSLLSMAVFTLFFTKRCI